MTEPGVHHERDRGRTALGHFPNPPGAAKSLVRYRRDLRRAPQDDSVDNPDDESTSIHDDWAQV